MDLVVDSLLEVDPTCLGYDDQLALLSEIEHARSALDAQQQRTLAAIARGETSDKNWRNDEVACALRLAPQTAAARLHDARELLERLPLTFDRLADGSVTFGHARVLVEAIRTLDADAAARVEARVYAHGCDGTVSEFRRRVRRAAAAADPRTAQEKHGEQLALRRVAMYPDDHGMATVWAYLRADRAAALLRAVDDHAATLDDERTADQKRADVLGDLADLALESAPGAGGSPRPSVQVTVALSTLLGTNDAPGELSGYGPVPAALAREIAGDPSGVWTRFVTDTVGRLLDCSRSYAPPPSMRRDVVARDVTCRFPGCRRQARRCELDHVRPWPDGPTAEDNLHSLCPRHHHLKHEAGWSVARVDDGTTQWISPTGAVYEKPPEAWPDPGLDLCPF